MDDESTSNIPPPVLRSAMQWTYQIMWSADNKIFDDDVVPYDYKVGMILQLHYPDYLVVYEVKVSEIIRYPLEGKIMLHCDCVSVER